MIQDLKNIVIEYLMIDQRHVKLNFFYVMCDLILETSKFDYLTCTCPNKMCLYCIENHMILD